MIKIEKTIIYETKYISKVVLILSLLLQAVFLVIGKWDYTVLLGNFLSGIAGILNFFLMGLTIQNAVTKDAKETKNAMKISQTYRTLFLAVVLIIGFSVPFFDKWTTVIGLFFPRVAVSLHSILNK